MGINLDPSVFAILEKLEKEDGVSVKSLLTKLIEDEDKERHVVWIPDVGFTRVMCNRAGCFETRHPPVMGTFRD